MKSNEQILMSFSQWWNDNKLAMKHFGIGRDVAHLIWNAALDATEKAILGLNINREINATRNKPN